MRSVIFDLDGTLADTSADLISAANVVLGQDVLDPVADKAVAFGGGRAMLGLGFERLGRGRDETAIDAAYRPFLDAYQSCMAETTVPYDGVEAALDALAGQGWLLGVCTNKPIHLAAPLLEQIGLGTQFGAVLGAGSLDVRKPDPRHLLETIRELGGDARHSVLIGDSVTDRDAARNADVPCVLVTFGPEDMGVKALEPDGYLDHYDHLSGLLERIAAGW